MQYGYSLTSLNATGKLTRASGSTIDYNFTVNPTTGVVKFVPANATHNLSIALLPGEELNLYFITYVNSSANLYDCNRASYNATDHLNNSILNQYAEKCITILKPKLSVEKWCNVADNTHTSGTDDASPGDTIECYIKLTNYGSSRLSGVVVIDSMPAGWDYLANISSGAWNLNQPEGIVINEYNISSNYNNTVNFTNIILNAGDVRMIAYTAYITDNVTGGINQNCVNATGYDGNNTGYTTPNSCVPIQIHIPKLEVVKDVSQHDVEPGSEPLTTIIVENPTYAPIYNVTITDYLPRGFNFTNGTVKIDGVPTGDPYISGNQSTGAFACDNKSACTGPGAGTNIGLNVTWNKTKIPQLAEIPPKTIIILTFKSHVKCSVCNDTFNNTVNVSGHTGAGAIAVNGTYFEMKGYLADAELYKYASTNSPKYYEYVDYTIVIWNNPRGANIAPLVLNDTMPKYLKYVPGYAYVGNIRLEPTVCGDFKGKASMEAVQNGTGQGNCSTFGYVDSIGDSVGQTLYWNLSRWLFLTPGQQVPIKYRTQVIPGISGSARNDVVLAYLDPEHPELCLDCEFNMDASSVIAIINFSSGDPDPIETYTLNLKPGWNLISVPIRPYNTTLSDVLAPIAGKYTDVAAWNGQWAYRSYAYGSWFGDLATIEPKKGYWIYMTEAANLTIHGGAINSFNITLYGGWNLIGWPSTQSVPLSDLTINYVDFATWEDGRWVYRSYAYGDWFGELDTIEPGKGYWVNTAENSAISK
jgi:uncharacterized repeat protein (TIGR01451 family)